MRTAPSAVVTETWPGVIQTCPCTAAFGLARARAGSYA
ncbi:hypothetical protein FM106_04560 [Brachybacterium faecium]|nr:hypothetical protein FM106_04560 [Brachybacterium faecium]